MRFALAVLLLASTVNAAPPTAKVTSVRRGLVYVPLGREHGVRSDDVLRVPTRKATLRIVVLGARQLSATASGGRVRRGDRVVAPRAPSKADELPVRRLPRPATVDADAARHAWAEPWQFPRVRFSGGAAALPENELQVAGDLSLSWSGLFDSEDRDLDLHRLRIRSRLAVDGFGSGYWRHDVTASGDFGPRLSERGGAQSRPYVRIRLAELGLNGPMSASLGRVPAGGFGRLDGARIGSALGAGLELEAFGGMVPDLLDGLPSTDSGLGGLRLGWRGKGDGWIASAGLYLAASSYRGAFDRAELILDTGLWIGPVFDVWGSVSAVALGYDDVGAELTRGFVGLRSRPLSWLVIDAHFAHYVEVPTRELVERLGPHALIDRPRESARLGLRFEPSDTVTVRVGGSAGFGKRGGGARGGDGTPSAAVQRARVAARRGVSVCAQ